MFKLSFAGNVQALAPFLSGKLHGYVRFYEQWFGQANLSRVAYFEDGVMSGRVWKLFEENGFLVGNNFDLTGAGIYIYPGKNYFLRSYI